jgi:hypothetical protein
VPSTSFFLLRLFWPLTIAQAHTGAAAVFVDEFDAGQLQSRHTHRRPER